CKCSAPRSAKPRAARFATPVPDELAPLVIRRLLEKFPAVASADVEDVILGCAMPEAESGGNMASHRRPSLPASPTLSPASPSFASAAPASNRSPSPPTPSARERRKSSSLVAVIGDSGASARLLRVAAPGLRAGELDSPTYDLNV